MKLIKTSIIFSLMSFPVYAGGPLCENGDPIVDCPGEGKPSLVKIIQYKHKSSEMHFRSDCREYFEESNYIFQETKILTTDTKKFEGKYIFECTYVPRK
jgi:hypothetical protein